MLSKLLYYGNENNGKIRLFVFFLLIAIIMGVIPFVMAYQIIVPLIHGKQITENYLLFRVAGMLIALILQGVFYGRGLALSHEAAYETLMNLRVCLQEKLEKQPLGVI
ncbi:hypothetical protein LL033_07450 [Clostridium estertheticum]|uniref:hypothetical protein n=1 Tax=Clostridium estertheticum TaxID=238834 RepID=UPI001C0D0D3F|nr:hypothetical protein [Clostridium estertheticum]MBU3214646.1 hypothetical protein [Clostridium estertheticum]WAG57060.1 hypothetical protein LL033_07450 [Clostridium estertheticum]